VARPAPTVHVRPRAAKRRGNARTAWLAERLHISRWPRAAKGRAYLSTRIRPRAAGAARRRGVGYRRAGRTQRHAVRQAADGLCGRRLHVDQDRVHREVLLALAREKGLAPLGLDLALPVGDEDEVATPQVALGEAAGGSLERRAEVGAAAGEVLRQVERALERHRPRVARVHLELAQPGFARGEADHVAAAAPAPRQLHEGESDRLRPQLLVARHRRRGVEAHHDRPVAALVGAAQRIGEHAAVEQPALEVTT